MKRRTLFSVVTLTVTAALAGFSLLHSQHRGEAQKQVTLPDLPEAGGTAARLPNGWHVTPAGTPIALPGDLPLKMLFSPDGKYLIVNTAGWHDHSVNVINTATNTLTQSVNVGKDWAGVCLDPVTQDVFVSGGGAPSADFLVEASKMGATPAMVESFKHPILRLAYAQGKLTPLPALDIVGLKPAEQFIAGVTPAHIKDNNGYLYVVNTQNDTVYATSEFSEEKNTPDLPIKVGYRPYAAVVSPDDKTLAVSNWGDGSLSLIETGTEKERVRVKVGNHPNEMVWSKDGRLFVANSGSNSVSVIVGGRVTETIKTSLSPTDPVGSTPDALALSPGGRRLYVANADNNDVAVIDVSNLHESRVLGFIPTGWYPSALAVAPDGRTLYVGTGKGLTFAANAPVSTPYTRTQPVSGQKYDYIGGVLSGAVSVVPVPSPQRLAAYTRQVYANTPHFAPPAPNSGGARQALAKIKHVLYIIRENRTYDQVFGDIKAGNGDPNLTIFGDSVTPNAHALAAHYVLLDNLYCNGEVSEDGHKWCDAAYATDFIEKAWPSSYSDRGEPDADERLTDSPAGAIWDNCKRHGLTYRSYGEAADFKSTPNAPPVFTGDKGLTGHASAAWRKSLGRGPGHAARGNLSQRPACGGKDRPVAAVCRRLAAGRPYLWSQARRVHAGCCGRVQ